MYILIGEKTWFIVFFLVSTIKEFCTQSPLYVIPLFITLVYLAFFLLVFKCFHKLIGKLSTMCIDYIHYFLDSFHMYSSILTLLFTQFEISSFSLKESCSCFSISHRIAAFSGLWLT